MARSQPPTRSRRWIIAGLGVSLAALASVGVLAISHCRAAGSSSSSVSSPSGPTSLSSLHGPDPRAQPRGSISGTVKSEAGAVIAQALVCAGASDDELATVLTRELPCVETNARGTYTLTAVLPGLYKVTATARSYMPGVHHPGGDAARTLLELAPGQHAAEIDLTLHAGGVEVTGVISDVTGGPIARARLEVEAARTETDAAGRFSLWVEPGPIWLYASASGYVASSRDGLAPGKLSLTLTPESTLSGTVVDPTGAPVAGALVFAEPTDPEGKAPPSSVSGADGRFTITEAAPGAYTLTARTERGFGRTDRTTSVGLGAHASGVTVTLHRAFVLSGTVMADDRPCIHADLWVGAGVHGLSDVPVRTGLAGARTALGLTPGMYTVRAWCDGFIPTPPVQIEITDRDVVDQIWRVLPGATIRGRVLDRRGGPIAGDVVQLSADGIVHSSPQRTGADGKFSLTGLPPATFEVSVKHGTGELPLAPIAVPERATIDRDLVVDDTGAIRGVVAGTDGRPVPGRRIDASATGDPRWQEMVFTGDDGRFAFDGVPPGPYRVSTFPNERELEVTVRAGKTSEVRLEVEARSGVIRGTVVGSDGAPIADAFVTVVTSSQEEDAASTSTGAGGAFELRSLQPRASYWLRAYRPGGGSATVRDVNVGDTVEIRIQNEGSIEGTVTGAPDPVTLELAGATHQKLTLFRTGGRYTFSGLPPGSYTITANVEHRHARADVVLAEGEHRRGVEIRVQPLTTITGRMVDARTRAPVAGLLVNAAQPGDDVLVGSEEGKTDATGRFTLRNLQPGAWMIYGEILLFPRGVELTLCAELRHATGEHFDAGDLPVLPIRPARDYALGFHLDLLDGKRDPPAWQARVLSVGPGSPAEKAGLRPGDVITAVNGTDVGGTHLSLLYALALGSPDGVAKLTLARGVKLSVALTPVEWP